MKKLYIIVILLLVLLTSCSTPPAQDTHTTSTQEPDNSQQEDTIHENYFNTTSGCYIDNIIYTIYDGLHLRRFSTAVPEGMSLCFDPLCSHSAEDFCAEWSKACAVVSDGRRLYIKNLVRNMAYITSIGFDGSGRKTLCEYSICDGLVTGISTDGEYVYYVEGLYRDSNNKNGEPYGIPMRISCDGGRPEAFLDIEVSAYAEIFADAENYYITDDVQFHIIDRETKQMQTALLPTASHTDGVVLHGDNIYILGASAWHEYKINCQFQFLRRALWKWNGASFDKIISDIDVYTWDENGVWYTKMLPVEEFVHIGSKETYDGKGMSLYDFIRKTTGELIYYDLETGEETVYRHENENLAIDMIGVSNGYIIATINDCNKLAFDYENVNLKPEADGTVTIHGAIKAETEVQQ